MRNRTLKAKALCNKQLNLIKIALQIANNSDDMCKLHLHNC